MTGLHAGQRVRVRTSLIFPLGDMATVTDPANGLVEHTVTARYDFDGRECVFRPDELESTTDGTEAPTGDDRAQRAGGR